MYHGTIILEVFVSECYSDPYTVVEKYFQLYFASQLFFGNIIATTI